MLVFTSAHIFHIQQKRGELTERFLKICPVYRWERKNERDMTETNCDFYGEILSIFGGKNLDFLNFRILRQTKSARRDKREGSDFRKTVTGKP